MKKVLILLGVCLVVAVLGASIFGRMMIGYLTPDLLVQQIESRLDCRAEVDSVDAWWLGKSKIQIHGLSLAGSDEFVESATPLDKRLPMSDPPIRVALIELDLQPGSLLLRRLKVKKLSFDGVEVDVTTREDGSSSLDTIFGKRSSSAPGDRPPGTTEPTDETAPATKKEESDTFYAGKIPIAILADRAGVTNSRISVFVEKTGASIELKEANFEFSGIDINPKNLAEQNQADFEFSGKIELGKSGSAAKALEALVHGAGRTKPFDPEKAMWSPSWESEIVLAKGSRLDTVPIVEKVKEKLAAINRPGIELSGLMSSGELVADAVTEISYERGRYRFERDFVLDFGNDRLDVHPQSWIDAVGNQHEVKGAVTGSEAFTKEVETKAQAYLDELTGGRAPSALVNTLMLPITKEGRLHLEVVSSGDLSKPQADLVTPIGNLRDLIKGSGDTMKNLKEFGRGFLKGMLDRNKGGE